MKCSECGRRIRRGKGRPRSTCSKACARARAARRHREARASKKSAASKKSTRWLRELLELLPPESRWAKKLAGEAAFLAAEKPTPEEETYSRELHEWLRR